MSWLTPFQNLIIRFKVGSGGSGGSGITEEYLNSKLAAFYTATETKLLNLVNSKLDTYVLKTDFTALNTTVTQLQEKVNNLPSGDSGGAKLSKIYGYIYINQPPTTFTNLTWMGATNVSSITIPSSGVIQFADLNKYIISYQYLYNTKPDSLNGVFVYSAHMGWPDLGKKYLAEPGVYFLTNQTTAQTVTWKSQPFFEVEIILSDTLENITANTINKKQRANLLKINNENTLNVKSWVNIGGD